MPTPPQLRWGGTSDRRPRRCAEARLQAGQDLVARAPVGVEPDLARAFDRAGIRYRPVLDLDRHAAGEFQRLVVGLGRQRDDELEGAGIDIAEGLGVMAM